MHSAYEQQALAELRQWQADMLHAPGLWDRTTSGIQRKVNSYIPEQVHAAITAVIRQMTQAVITGSGFVASQPLDTGDLEAREKLALAKIDTYRKTAAVEGGVTGAGGLFLGLADFPLLIGIKLNLLFELAGVYGHAAGDLRERIYLLHIFQLAFSSDAHRRDVYLQMVDWRQQCERLPPSPETFDWRKFQQEYRNYIDLAKLMQLVPLIGAPVGLVVNNSLVKKLGRTAMNAYRMRWFEDMRTGSSLAGAGPAKPELLPPG